jgi:hypothetical protein
VSVWREAVEHAGVRRSKRETAHEIVGLHLAELFAKHLRGNARHRAP